VQVVEGKVQDVDARVQGVHDAVQSIGDGIRDVRGVVEGVGDDTKDVQHAVQSVNVGVKEVQDTVRGVDTGVQNINHNVQDVSDQVQAVRDNVAQITRSFPPNVISPASQCSYIPKETNSATASELGSLLRIHLLITTPPVTPTTRDQLNGSFAAAFTKNGSLLALSYGYMENVCSSYRVASKKF
jgi:hypothetical protein